jgi:4-amino-4-deoxy-L-arabinose transferase-like glycosyltransferase
VTHELPAGQPPDAAAAEADFPEAYSSASRSSSEKALRLGQEAVIISLILLVALAARVLFIYQIETSAVSALAGLRPGTDMAGYDTIARWVLANGWFEKSADVSPLYPYAFLPLAYLATSGSIFWTKVIQAFMSTGTVFVIYLIARRLYGGRAAIYAGILACLYAPFVVYQGQLLGEFLLDFFTALFFLVLLGVEGRISYRRAAVAGVALGLAIAAKPTAAVFLPLALAWVARRAGWSRRSLTSAAAPAALLVACAVAVTLPFTWRNWKATGQASLVRGNSGIMLYMGNNPTATGAFGYPSDEEGRRLAELTRDMTLREKDRTYHRAAIAFIKRNPRQFLGLIARKASLFFSAEEVPNNLSMRFYRQLTFLGSWVFVSWGLVLPLAATGFALSVRRRGVWLLATGVLLYAAAIVALVVVGRYRLAVVPLLLPAAGFAAYEAVLALRSLQVGRLALIAFIVACIALPVNAFALSVTLSRRLHPAGFLEKAAGGKLVLRDDSNAPTPFSIMFLSPDTYMQKFLILERPTTGLRSAAVLLRIKVTAGGTLRVRLNDASRDVQLIPVDARWLRIEFPAEAVDTGTNAVTLRASEDLGMRLYADDMYNFGRSVYSPDGVDILDDRLDQTTYRSVPSLHMGGRELKVRLELDYSAQPT